MLITNQENQLDLLCISVPGPITVDILGSKTIDFEVPELRLSSTDTLSQEQMNILQVMMKLMAQMNPEQN
ncbi:hypothetical protein [Alicyclobacillus sp. SO9]|uniref:hypothetical protein n=1 Tax=Alicyclobacillus sp. SO9 TaxID=2665646 RepID=UPI0018E820CF|nr:hypothetical protein [Alicyclobacillus sp. SO9]